MSPKRSSSTHSRRVSSASSLKPYTSGTILDATSTRSTEIAQLEIAQQDATSKPGFPTRAQYQHIETVYLNSLTSRRKEKALISRSMFDRIWDVLQNRDDSPEDGQFKFWVRRNFALGTVNKANLDPGILARLAPDSQAVLLHNGSLVALQEELYDLLCFAHGLANHGGRDKTHTALRKYYTWVPKEIVAQFIISCPTCMMKKAGLSKKRPTTAKNDVRNPNESYLPALHTLLSNCAAQEGYDIRRHENGWPLAAGLASDHGSGSTPDFRSTEGTSAKDIFGSPSDLQAGPRSHPMSREVSLYLGLPNGWQFHTDYATAHAEFMKRKNEGTLNPPDAELGKKRPRIPSVAPLIGPDYVPHHDNISDEDLCSGTLPSIMRRPSCDGESNESRSFSPSLQSFHTRLSEAFPIDPVLLAMASPLNSSSPNPPNEHDSDDKTSKIHRAAAPPALDLAYLSSMEAIEAFFAHRNARNLSRYSPLSQAPLDSPASNVGSSCLSQRSAFPMMTTSCSSAATSALPTPVDDDIRVAGLGKDVSMDKLVKELAVGAEEPMLTSSISGVSLQAVCHEVV